MQETIHCENADAIDALVELLETSIVILQFSFSPNFPTRIEVWSHHNETWNRLMNILHERQMQDAVEEILAARDDDDSEDSTETNLSSHEDEGFT